MAWITLLHLLCLVYWLGADIGTFYAARFVAKPALSLQARGTAATIMHGIDLLPRVAMPLTLASGMQLASTMGLLPLGATSLAGVWAVCLGWLAAAAWIHLAPRTPLLERAVRIDFGFRIAVIALLAAVALLGLAGVWAAPSPWLAWKLLAFAATVACGLAIRVALRPFGPAFGRLLTQGSSPEVEAVLAGSIARAVPWVLAIWVLLLLAAALGVRAINIGA
jgi:hypothetical protein